MKLNVVFAIFKRNLVSYFSTPTGYVFICLFVFLCSVAAFWPNEFFTANLANLDQLNRWIAGILLIFIPAITMSIWADERRQGTDELLLTIPASDLDVVLGKYLAASGIFSISLLFSMFCNIIVLLLLSDGQLDYTRFYSTYFGYWLTGEAMLAIGMVASFLTSNLTVSFILGALFNAPFVAMQWIDEGWFSDGVARWMRNWSYSGQFLDFGRGVFSFSGLVYFGGIILLGLYLCMVLIGKRHWSGGKDGTSLGWHYVVRFFGLIGIVLGVNALVGGHAIGRLDVSQDQINSLSTSTISVLQNLDKDNPVTVEAYFSPKLPEDYQRQRLVVETFLREMEKHSAGKLVTRVVNLEPNTDEAANARDKYEIPYRKIVVSSDGSEKNMKQVEMYMGLVFKAGLKTQVIPFLGKDSPVEYELLRNIWAVNQKERKKLGLLKTEAVNRISRGRFGGEGDVGLTSFTQHLRTLYEVIDVDASNDIPLTTEVEDPETKKMKTVRNYDVVVAVQPSTLNPTAMTNFVKLVKSGQATLILEDPIPAMIDVTGTFQEKRQRMTQFGMPEPSEPKGDIRKLWDVLGVELERYDASRMTQIETLIRNQTRDAQFRLNPGQRDSTKVVWSEYKPDKKLAEFDRDLPKEFAWIASSDPKSKNPFNQDVTAVAGLNQILYPIGGSWKPQANATSSTKYLVRTGKSGGTLPAGAAMMALTSGTPEMLQLFEDQLPDKEFTIAIQVSGKNEVKAAFNLQMADDGAPKQDLPPAPSKDAAPAPSKDAAPAPSKDAAPATTTPAAPAKEQTAELNVMLLADIDMISDIFFQFQENRPVSFQLENDNIPLVLNMVDALAKVDSFIELRKKRVQVRPLVKIDEIIETNAKSVQESRTEFNKKLEDKIESLDKEITEKLTELEKKRDAIEDRSSSAYEEAERSIAIFVKNKNEEAKQTVRTLQDENKKNIELLERDLNKQLRAKQEWYKAAAALIPPIPPLLVAFFVFFSRRLNEKQGVNVNRLR